MGLRSVVVSLAARISGGCDTLMLHHIAYGQRIADLEAVAKAPSPLDAATGGYPEDAKFDSWVCGQF
jgi:hypothetical protein